MQKLVRVRHGDAVIPGLVSDAGLLDLRFVVSDITPETIASGGLTEALGFKSLLELGEPAYQVCATRSYRHPATRNRLERLLIRTTPAAVQPQHAENESGTLMEQFQKSIMDNEEIDKEEIWSSIHYLDPDEREKDKEVNTATIIATVAILLIVGGVWVLLWFRFRQP
jgi:hypothetical protein